MLENVLPQRGWIKTQSADLQFLFLVPIIAITAGYITVIHPQLFPYMFILNVWFLGYRHVVATYTRIPFSRQSVKEHRFFCVPTAIAGAGRHRVVHGRHRSVDGRHNLPVLAVVPLYTAKLRHFPVLPFKDRTNDKTLARY